MQPTEVRKRKHPIKQMKAWIHRHPTATYALVGFGLILAASITAFAILWQEPQKLPPLVMPAKPKPKPVYYAPLTGLKVATEADITKPVTAIMIENSPDARPQSGLKDAEIVYEAVAEGGITRFLALYQQNKPKLVGPVRSLRPYYVSWLTPYNASVAHVGGSLKSLQMVRRAPYRDIDQFFNAGTYWRAADRYAPHNVYTSFARLDALNKSKGYKTSKPKPFARETEKTARKQNAHTINLGISGPLYNSSYSYSAKTKDYARSQAGAPHVDREKGRIRAKVVIALEVTMNHVLEDGYRENIVVHGTGTAYLFQNGSAQKVKWHKSGNAAQLKFTDAKGGVIYLERGNIWISAIPKGTGSISWK